MNYTTRIAVVTFICLATLAVSASAAEQKMIVVKGQQSYLMDGDSYKNAWNKPQGYSKDSVLPALLSIGWRIKSIHVNEKSTEANLYGYVLLVKD